MGFNIGNCVPLPILIYGLQVFYIHRFSNDIDNIFISLDFLVSVLAVCVSLPILIHNLVFLSYVFVYVAYTA